MTIDLSAAIDAACDSDAGVPAGRALLRFANAAHHLEPSELARARADLERAVGPVGLDEASATVAVFNGLVRVADGTGIEVDAGVLADSADFRAELGVDGFAGAENTTTTPVAVPRSSVSDLFA
ncbi:MAG: hypothetical protein OEV40_24610 [Acidimicrobiia bacterium]|nr:hypothetical protein [Acidimicrobiia bacterium]